MAAGVPSAALSLAVVESARTGRHAVLLANTDRGDFVLDNLEPWVLPWAKTRYTWIKRETGSSPTQWATLEVERIQKIVARRSDLIAMGAGDGAVGGIPSEH